MGKTNDYMWEKMTRDLRGKVCFVALGYKDGEGKQEYVLTNIVSMTQCKNRKILVEVSWERWSMTEDGKADCEDWCRRNLICKKSDIVFEGKMAPYIVIEDWIAREEFPCDEERYVILQESAE